MPKWMMLFALIPLTACGTPRRYGDDQGIPVAFEVHLDRAFVKGMSNRQWRPSVGAGASYGSGGYSSYGTGVGLSFSSTEVFLLGGEGTAESQIFRREISWGDTSFTVPLAVGHVVHLTVMAQGGRDGWESIGAITIPKAIEPRVVIRLDDRGGSVTMTPAPDAPAPSAAPVPEPTDAVRPAEDHGDPAKPADEERAPVELRVAPPPRAVTPAAPYPDPALDR